ncbi:MAG TPA: putative baseplate assembly protein [Solirubrobacteraceae bacterium]|jgi:predicted phage baseplate assembly protein|nr:putative baseplate assembly protein [Solirubrobacteraceae bacterium]
MLPEILLDDVRFQELVSEARTRIVRHAPEWTEHNVSDPGITLIELYAWLTELLVYRINRIPERLHFGLLALVGVEPRPPECASVPVRFIIDQPGGGAVVQAGTEIASPRTAGSESVVFQTAVELVVPHECKLASHSGSPSAAGDALLLGFDSPIAGLVIQLRVESSRAEGSADPSDPPLQWEASIGDGDWERATVVSDETGGFTFGGGAITVHVPEAAAEARIEGARRHWLRCRVLDRRGEGGDRGVYTTPPEITSVEALIAGAMVEAYHAATVTGELLGTSEGIPGATYPLPRHPVLTPEEGEAVEVRELGSEEWVAWQQVESFEFSSRTDRHFQLDTARGEIRFGPAVRQPDGGWRRYGAVPPGGAVLRMSRYRYGGGSDGNVAPRALSILPHAVPGIASATNPTAATGGVELESLDSARERARLEIRARTRAVTNEDFERLTLAASPQVARAVCVGPDEAGFGRPVRVHVLPRVDPADRLLEADELIPDGVLMAELAAALDEYRLLGTSIKLLPARLRGVSIVVDVRASPRADLERVQHDVAHALYIYLNPLIGGTPTGPAGGWPLGRSLNQGELFGIVYAIPGVEFVNILRMYETNVRTGEQAPQPTDSRLVLAPDELIASGRHIVKASHRE